MSLFKRLLQTGLGCCRGGAESGLPEELGERDALGILWRTGRAFLRGALWRARLGAADGPLFVGARVTIQSPGRLRVGRNVKIEDHAEVQALARRGVELGDGVTVGRGASIRPSSYYGHDLGEGLRVGAGTAIGAGSWIGASGFVDIGANVLFGPRVVVIPENHNFEDPDALIKDQGVTRAGVVIEDDCWIGCNATILAGVRIGRGSIVAAGAVVNKDVAPGTIVGGVPARVLRERAAPPPSFAVVADREALEERCG